MAGTLARGRGGPAEGAQPLIAASPNGSGQPRGAQPPAAAPPPPTGPGRPAGAQPKAAAPPNGRGTSGDPELGHGGGQGQPTSGQDSPAQSSGSTGHGVGALSLPTSMKVVGNDGKVSVISFGVSAADGVSHCCGLPPPPGGWFGPFGFFRLMSYALACVAVLALLLALLSCCFQDILGFLSNVLLAFAAVCCAVAAYSHEGLANEVTAMARQNDLFAEKNEQLAKQTEQLGGVAKRLDSLQQSLNVHLDELQGTLTALHSVTATEQLATMIRAFTDADSDGTTDQRLNGSEVEDFFGTCGDLLRQAAPDFDVDHLQQEAKANGVGIEKMRFLVNAVVASGDSQPGRSTAMLCLVLFSADPKQNFEKCQEALRVVLKRSSLEDIKATLQEKVDKSTDAKGMIPCNDLQDVAKRVMLAST